MSPSVPKPPAKLKAAKKRPNPVNPKRRKSEFARTYGSKERVEFVKALPCITGHCWVEASENAHIETGGMGRKADANTIVPLCHNHHYLFHTFGRTYFEVSPLHLNLDQCAADTERLWLQFNHPDGVTEP